MALFGSAPFDGPAAEPLVRIASLGGLLLWSVLEWRHSSRLAPLLSGALLSAALSCFWSFSLPRPYGFLSEPGATKRLATASTIAASGDASETCLAREANPHRWRDGGLAATGLSPEGVDFLFRLLPALLPACAALGVGVLYRGPQPLVAASLLVLFWPAGEQLLPAENLMPPASFRGDPWGATGVVLLVVGSVATRPLVSASAFLFSLWADPGLLPALAALVGGQLFFRRHWEAAAATGVLAAAVAAASFKLIPWPGPSGPDGGPEILVWATLGQPLWLLLAAQGLRAARAALEPALAIGAGSALLLILAASGAKAVPVAAALALYRLAVLLSAAPALAELAGAAGAWLGRPQLGRAALLLCGGLASPLLLASPPRFDHHYRLSQAPVDESYLRVSQWIAHNTPADAVLVADRNLAPLFAVAAGRRFLRAGDFLDRPGDPSRAGAEAIVLGGRRPERIWDAARRFGVTHLALNRAAPGGPQAEPESFEGRQPFARVYQAGSWFYLFAVTKEN